jgi:transposase-like protein
MGGVADNGRMRNRQEIRGIVDSYAKSGMTRREYCEKHDIPITTLDYWRRAEKSKLKLVEIAEEPQPSAGFALVLANGRRVESSWRFAEADLLRLIRVVEA